MFPVHFLSRKVWSGLSEFSGEAFKPERCGHTKTAINFFGAESSHHLAIKWLIYRVLRNAEDFWSSIRSFKVRDNSFGGLDAASEIMYHYHPKLCLQMISSGSGTLFWQVPALKPETNVTALLERCKKNQVRQFFPVFSGTFEFYGNLLKVSNAPSPCAKSSSTTPPNPEAWPRTRPARCALLAASSAATQRPWICRSLEVCTFTKVEVFPVL